MFDRNRRYDRPIVPPIVTQIGEHSSVAYKKAICQNRIGMDMNPLVGMAL